MRWYRKAQIVLSEDDNSSPQMLRFSDSSELTDNGSSASIASGGGDTITIAPNTTDFALPMPPGVTGKYLYLYSSDNPFSFKVGSTGNAAMAHAAKKPSELWVDYAGVYITTGATAVRLTFVTAGK